METTVQSTTNTFAPVTFTEGAIKELRKLIEQKELTDEFGLRVGVEGGGCAGMNYVLGFDKKKEGDEIFFVDGIQIYLNKAHNLYLVGMQVDWQDGLNARGFTFNNPNATSTCGCGSSFSA
ncbi:iron-sulfur cluster assembly accessory protein [Solitalea sp. MAHUQ-68]|uniref:Iron-sulfur cluster assembly accessory protein n=1 Tax=Solitalea agri TaxID=2953739 RepID=A0A9X2F303_9SPHI|nr:iron-sulfur cluster assembly accessory protein [Solitalea agri]MCO4293254.1 iron-sulfur cluster assembly accessory protein [Solitalea agri]